MRTLHIAILALGCGSSLELVLLHEHTTLLCIFFFSSAITTFLDKAGAPKAYIIDIFFRLVPN